MELQICFWTEDVSGPRRENRVRTRRQSRDRQAPGPSCFRKDHEVEELQIMLTQLADGSNEVLGELFRITAFAGHTSSVEYLLDRRPPD